MSFAAASSRCKLRTLTARNVVGIFFPQHRWLRLDSHGYSPRVFERIVIAGGQLKSFKLASVMLDQLSDIHVAAPHVRTLTLQVGGELAEKRDQQTQDWIHDRLVLTPDDPPAVAVVEPDGGRIMTRQPGRGPGVHEQAWREDKVGCVLAVESRVLAADPQPQPPARFRDPKQVDELARQIKSQIGLGEEESARKRQLPPEPTEEPPAATTAEDDWRPQRKLRTCVASMQDSEDFGWMLAAEARRRRFFESSRQAFVADGQRCNWTIHEKHFPEFTPIVDFVHVLAYIYLAATAVAANAQQRWSLYLEWMTACWKGQAKQTTDFLGRWLETQQPFDAEGLPATDPRAIVQKVRQYLLNNAGRMDYPTYRKTGLPVTSSAIESLIKEVNYRVKGTEKFWNRPDDAERILQIRTALLSDDDRLADHFAHRPGNIFRRPSTARQNAQHAAAA